MERKAVRDISVEKFLSVKRKTPVSIGIINASFVGVILKISSFASSSESSIEKS